MKNKKILYLGIISLNVILLIVACLVYYNKPSKKNIDTISFEKSYFSTIYDYDKLINYVENEYSIKFENIFIEDICNIETNNKGDITDLLVNLYYVDGEIKYRIQWELNNDKYSLLIQEHKNDDIKVEYYNLNIVTYLEIIAKWNYDKEFNQVLFMWDSGIKTKISNNINNGIKEVYHFDNQVIQKLDHEKRGKFKTICVIENKEEISHIYVESE